MKKIVKLAVFSFIFGVVLFGCSTTSNVDYDPIDEEKIMEVVNEVGMMFRYYLELGPNTKNVIIGPNEVGGQCGDYALAFVNIWNKKYPKQEALLVIQQQPKTANFPDGFYKVVGKDHRDIPFTKNWNLSGLYYIDRTKGFFHPILDNYLVRLVKSVHVKSHFGLPNWERNGPHIWVMIGDVIVDPTYADIWGSPIIGKDVW